MSNPPSLDPWPNLARRAMRHVLARKDVHQDTFIGYLKAIGQDTGGGFHGQLARGTVPLSTYIRALWYSGNPFPEDWKDVPFSAAVFKCRDLLHAEAKRWTERKAAALLEFEVGNVRDFDYFSGLHVAGRLVPLPEGNLFYEIWAANVMKLELENNDMDIPVLSLNFPKTGVSHSVRYLREKFNTGTLRLDLAIQTAWLIGSDCFSLFVDPLDCWAASGF